MQPATTDKTLKIGFNTFDGDVYDGSPSFVLPAESGRGVDFVLCHFDPHHYPLDEASEKAKAVAEKIKERGMEFIANFEFQNFVHLCRSVDHDWANRPDGTHRLDIPEKYIKALAGAGNLIGVMHDEFEHTIINQNLSIILASRGKTRLPVFPLSESSDPMVQSRLLDSQLKEYADEIKAKGAPLFTGEHVFPVFYHKFARSGIVPNFKSQKESYSNLQFATAAGAALQYGTPLYNCVDLWFMNTNPGHSPEEMYHNLLFAYYAGVNRVYVESAHCFVDGDPAGLNAYGKKFAQFSAEYRGRERDYDIADYRPEIGIIRFDDSFWGQGDPVMWRYMLFGNPKIKPTKESKEWIKAFRLITHGETGRHTFCWDKIAPSILKKHRSFAAMNSAAVFDENVGKETLSSLKLCFLCGSYISAETLQAVRELVKENGLTVVTPKRYAPKSIGKETFRILADGKGKWIVCDNLLDSKVKEFIAPFLGRKGEIRLTFAGGREIRLKISKNGEGFTVIKE